MNSATLNKQSGLPKWVLFLYLFFVMAVSFTKLSIPAFGLYEITVADLSILFVAFICIAFPRKIEKKLSYYLVLFFVFFASVSVSIIGVQSMSYYITDLVPYIFAFPIIYSTLVIFSSFDKLKIAKYICIAMILALLLSTIPVYYQVVTGTKLGYYFDRHGWRYTFLSQNPNQYGVTLVLYFMTITLFTYKYFGRWLLRLFILMLLFIPVAFFTGSRTTTLLFTLNLFIMGFIVFSRSSTKSKLTVVPLLTLAIALALPHTIDFLRTKGGQIGRALKIFEYIEEKGIKGVQVGGDSGDSMNEAIQIFSRHPFFGVGLANKPMHSAVRTEIHNTYLKMLAETGIVGVIGFSIIFFLPMIAMIFSRNKPVVKIIFILFYIIFCAMNWPYMLLRQRWVWLFMVLMFILARMDNKGNVEMSKFKLLN